jgi:hypothetical protein
MIVLRLNGADISLTRAFIPLWVVDGILLIGILAMMCLKLCDEDDYDDCSDKLGTCCVALFAFCVVAMLPLFKIFLAAVDAGTLAMSMRMICIPLFIFFGLVCLLFTFIAFMIHIGQNSDD